MSQRPLDRPSKPRGYNDDRTDTKLAAVYAGYQVRREPGRERKAHSAACVAKPSRHAADVAPAPNLGYWLLDREYPAIVSADVLLSGYRLMGAIRVTP